MSRRKLTDQQKTRSRSQQQKRRQRATQADRNLDQLTQSGQLSSEQQGLVICRHREHFEVQALEGELSGTIHHCVSRTNIGSLVAGDQVVWQAAANLTGVIVSRHPREHILERPDNFGKLKPVAANMSQMLIVIAVEPEPQQNLIDRYLVAAELMQIKPVIVLNKIDLLTPEKQTIIKPLIELYQSLGYDISQISCSRHFEPKLDNLPQLIDQQTSIVVGQSGVGKSSLINTLLPEAKLATGELSATTGEGTHTTTQAKLFHLPSGGQLIDSPGIRDFGLWHISPQQLQVGFIEFNDHLGGCRFRDCKHENEPGCAILAAVENGQISARRFDSYLRIKQAILEQNARGLSL